MFKILFVVAVFSISALRAIGAEPAKGAAVAVTESEATVELVSVDRDKRTVVVRGPTGAILTLTDPREAQNLDRVKPGDLFMMRYVEALALTLHKGGGAFASELQTVELAPKGGTPGGRVVNTKQITAVVADVDRTSRTLTVQGPQKNVLTLRVAGDVQTFDEIAVGDTIALTYTEALVLEMMVGTGAGSSPERGR
jgi:hypothetical protein